MKALVFDSSTLISIATNNLLWTLPLLKEKFGGEFYITESVKVELINVPLKSRRFKLEAMQLLSMIADGTIKIYKSSELENKANRVLGLINNIYSASGNYITIVQKAEVEALVLSAMLDCVFAVDERTIRLFMEDYKSLHNVFSERLHTEIKVNESNLALIGREVHKVPIIRSVELMTMAYKLGLMQQYLDPRESKIANIDLKKTLLEGLLWGLRLRGCSVSTEEIDEIMLLHGF